MSFRLKVLLWALLVSLAIAFSPRSTFGVTTRRTPIRTPRVCPHRSTRSSPCFVQTSLDETTTTTPTTSSIPDKYSDFFTLSSSLSLKKLVNGAFLLVCFGCALYTILNIDHGMMRGWTQSEIAMRIPLDNWSSYESALLEKPIFTKTCINVVIYLLGDWLSQTIFAGQHVLDFNVERTLKNGFIGLLFGPLVHEYYEFSDSILPVEGGMVNRASKILMDQTLYLTIKCSLYISAVGLLSGESLEEVQENVQQRIGPVVVTAWKFWPLVHCITYGLIPARHRILWVNCVDLVWNAILATKARSDGDNEEEEENVQENVNEKQDQVTAAVVCKEEEEEWIESIPTLQKEDGMSVQVFDATIQAQLLEELLPSQDNGLVNISATNCTSAETATA